MWENRSKLLYYINPQLILTYIVMLRREGKLTTLRELLTIYYSSGIGLEIHEKRNHRTVVPLHINISTKTFSFVDHKHNISPAIAVALSIMQSHVYIENLLATYLRT